MKVAKNLTELAKIIQNEYLKDVMNNEVAETVKKTQQKKVQEVVFSAYTPKIYERRKTDGLDDIDNMKHVVDIVGNEVQLTVTNETVGKDDPDFYIAGLIEHGDQNGYGEYDYTYDPYAAYLRPRPFIEETREELLKTDKLKRAMKKGLKNRGLTVK